MAIFQLLDNGEPVMVIAGVDKDQFEAAAREAGHPEEVLRPIGAVSLSTEVEIALADSDN